MKPRKEVYFQEDTILPKSQEMLLGLDGILRNRDPFVAEESALLVLDMQAYFLDVHSHAFIPSAPAILPGINRLIQGYTRLRLPIFLTRHINQDRDVGLMNSWWREVITIDHPFSGFSVGLTHGAGVEIIKPQYDAFYQTPLDDLLKKRNVRQVVICGVMTHLCCETTARSAFQRGYEVFFPVDGTATYGEAFHRASLLNLAHGFASIVLVGSILDVLDG